MFTKSITKRLFISLLATLFFIFFFAVSHSQTATKVFASGFESGVSIETVELYDGIYYSYFSGSDISGYTWIDDFPRGEESTYEASTVLPSDWFDYILNVPDGESFSDYHTTSINGVEGHDGEKTYALFMETKEILDNGSAHNRNEYNYIFPKQDGLYVKYWIKIQDDLEAIMPDDGNGYWRMIMEWKEKDDEGDVARFGFNIIRATNAHSDNPDNDLYWQFSINPDMRGDDTTTKFANYTSKVPLGEWFLLEVYWEQNINDPDNQTGKFWARINENEVLFNEDCDLFYEQPLTDFFMFKEYFHTTMMENAKAIGSTIYQYIDDVEVWNGMPEEAKITLNTYLENANLYATIEHFESNNFSINTSPTNLMSSMVTFTILDEDENILYSYKTLPSLSNSYNIKYYNNLNAGHYTLVAEYNGGISRSTFIKLSSNSLEVNVSKNMINGNYYAQISNSSSYPSMTVTTTLSISILDINGNVKSTSKETYTSGTNSFVLNTKNLNSGIYICKVTSGVGTNASSASCVFTFSK